MLRQKMVMFGCPSDRSIHGSPQTLPYGVISLAIGKAKQATLGTVPNKVTVSKLTEQKNLAACAHAMTLYRYSFRLRTQATLTIASCLQLNFTTSMRATELQ